MRGRRGAEKLGRDEKTVKQRQARRVEWAETALAPEKGILRLFQVFFQ